jgi:hypothetical protein
MHTLYKNMPANTEAEHYKHKICGSCDGENSVVDCCIQGNALL